jgi:hypothetical protein
VDLRLPSAGLDRYKSASQRARIGTESWGATNFFCPACESPRLNIAPRNTVAVDYFCPSCESPFQLKSQSKPLGTRIVDAAYSEMKRAILEDRTPNLFVLHYDLDAWAVRTVLLVPHFAFALSAVERRKPLAPTARRAGWVTLADVYAHAGALAKLYPNNAHVRDKIRQQLQVLRDDCGLLEFTTPGNYRLKEF